MTSVFSLDETVLSDEVARQKLAEASLKTIFYTISTHRGDAFFRTLVKELAQALEVFYVIAGRTAKEDGVDVCHTLTVWAGEDYMPNITYRLRGTPCNNVANQEMCFHPKGVQADYPGDSLLEDMGAESYIGMPMVDTEGRTLGILVALDTHPMSEGKRYLALSLLTIFATRAAAELQFQDREAELEELVNKRTLALHKSKELIEAIQRLQSRFITQPDPFHICQDLFVDLKRLTGSDYGFIGEVYSTPEGDSYVTAYAISMLAWNDQTRALYESAKEKGFEFHKLDNLFGRVITHREVVMSNDLKNDKRRGGLPKGHPPINNFLGIPVFYGEKLVGEIGLANREGGYDQEVLDYISPLVSAFGQIIVARQAQVARDAAEASLTKLARLDGLLGIPNRRSFDDYFTKQWRQAMRDEKPLSVIMIDIDHFKRYNDHYGHQQGDKCLIQISKIITKKLVRPSDLIARYGGEEFVCVLPDTTAEGALTVAEAIRSAAIDKAIPHATSPVAAHVTLSIGLATLVPSSDTSPDECISYADHALYRAKSEGRNRVISASP